MGRNLPPPKRHEASYEGNPDCDCNCFQVALDIPLPPIPLHFAEIQDVRTVGETQVAVLDGPLGLTTVFMRGDYFLTVEGDISLDENLKVIASLLEN